MTDDWRTRGSFERRYVVQRNHLASVRSHIKVVQIALGLSECLVRLYKHAISAVVVVKVVHVLRSHEYTERARDLGKRNTHGLGFVAVNCDLFLRIVCRKCRQQIGKLLLAAAGRDNLVRYTIESAERV